jgi:hypothetical protein
MKQTAVEWFWNNLTDDMIGDLHPWQIGSIYKLKEQAKEIEKEQIVDAVDSWIHTGNMKGEQYYNETFNNNG